MHRATGEGKRKSPKRFSLLTNVLIGERADRVEKSARSARSTRLSKRYGEVIGTNVGDVGVVGG